MKVSRRGLFGLVAGAAAASQLPVPKSSGVGGLSARQIIARDDIVAWGDSLTAGAGSGAIHLNETGHALYAKRLLHALHPGGRRSVAREASSARSSFLAWSRSVDHSSAAIDRSHLAAAFPPEFAETWT